MKANAFERLARLLLLSLNFSHVEVVGRSGDGGIDLLGIVRLNNVLSFRVLVQCKRYKDTVGPGEIRNFRGAMQGRTDKGIFITSGRYTREARHEASRDGVPARRSHRWRGIVWTAQGSRSRRRDADGGARDY